MMKLKIGSIVFTCVIMVLIGLGCSQGEQAKELSSEKYKEADAKVIADLILYQYAQELNTWKALSPKNGN